MKSSTFETEAALCAAFIDWVKRESGQVRHGKKTPVWTPYAETAGWDILLVAEDGTQIGIQAKQRFNLKVIDQCLPDSWESWHDRGPDYRAILIPTTDNYDKLMSALGLTVFQPAHTSTWNRKAQPEFAPGLALGSLGGWHGWHFWNPRERCKLPEYVPDVVAGDSGPVQLTQWKVAALKIVATLELRGYVTRQDFKTHSIDARRWTAHQGWLVPNGTPGQFARGPSLDFDKQHPVVYAQVLEDVRKVLVSQTTNKSPQGTLV